MATDPTAIVCTSCATEHSLAAAGEHCRECAAFLPEATADQQRLIGKRMEQQIRYEQGEVTVGGYVESVHGDDREVP